MQLHNTQNHGRMDRSVCPRRGRHLAFVRSYCSHIDAINRFVTLILNQFRSAYMWIDQVTFSYNACIKSVEPFYTVTYYKKWFKTSWTKSSMTLICLETKVAYFINLWGLIWSAEKVNDIAPPGQTIFSWHMSRLERRRVDRGQWSGSGFFFPEGSKLDPGETGGGVTEPLRAGPGPDLGSDNSKLWIIKLRTSLRLITYALPRKI